MAQYESEFTQFMREWMGKHPEEHKEQKSGRDLWWDKAPQPLDVQQREAAAKVPVKPYYYELD